MFRGSVPPAPTWVSAQSRLNDILVKWSWPTEVRAGISAYLLEGSSDGGATWLSAVVGSGNGGVYVNVPWGTNWSFRVSGINSSGVGPFGLTPDLVGRSEITLNYTVYGDGLRIRKVAGYYEVDFDGEVAFDYIDFSPSRTCKMYIEELGGSDYIVFVNDWHIVGADTFNPDPAHRPPHYVGGGTGRVFYEGSQYRISVQNGLWASLKFQPEDLMEYSSVTLS